jgi:hypothetical protein
MMVLAPIAALSAITAQAPTDTPAPISAVGATTAVSCIPAGYLISGGANIFITCAKALFGLSQIINALTFVFSGIFTSLPITTAASFVLSIW